MKRRSAYECSARLASTILLLVSTTSEAAQQLSSIPPTVPSDAAAVIDGPPPPVFPETMTRGADGKVTVRAIKLPEPLRVDGRLDDRVYTEERPFSGLLQLAPKYGADSSEKTEIWVMFDEDAIYVAAKCFDSAPPDKWVANELRRDTNQLRQNDNFGVMFDTFYDRRSGSMFYTNPLGALADYNVVDEGAPNTDWNPVWTVRTGRFEGGWTVEMAIPFKTLRYRSGRDQVWGFQARRSIRRKNEWTYLTPVPQNLTGPLAFNRISAAGTLVGLDLPPAARNLELKPYATAGVTTDRVRTPVVNDDVDANVGGDFKYGISANLTADLTVNTDFAQVEVDEQQVNLTRFGLFFPEKRDFFLEGRGIFDFARGGAAAGAATNSAQASDTPYLFYSRRIGLNRTRVVPIDVGGRITGKVGNFAVGVVNIQAGDEPVSLTDSTNFTVVRVKRDVLKRSTIGAMITSRSHSNVASGSNQAYGLDAAFSFYENVSMGAYYARTETPGLHRDNDSYQGKFEWSPDRYGVRAEYLKIGDNFNPEIGFVRRDNIRRSFVLGRFSPRPKQMQRVRKYTFEGSTAYFQNGFDDLESRQHVGRFNVELDNSDQITVEAHDNYELLLQPFAVGAGVTIPRGGYDFNDVTLTYQAGQQRRYSGTIAAQLGHFYDGTIQSISLTGARVAILKQLSVEPTVQINRIDLPYGELTQRLFRARTDYGFSPRMFASALLQYSYTDRTFSSNLRFRWEYTPGSELFIVWTDERDTTPRSGTLLRNQAFVIKLTRLWRF